MSRIFFFTEYPVRRTGTDHRTVDFSPARALWMIPSSLLLLQDPQASAPFGDKLDSRPV
jgi:hypothetical protein